MASYYVIERTQCPRCRGEKRIAHPKWAAFWKARRYTANKSKMNLIDAIRACFGEDPPPEEIECPDCDGLGTITREVPLAEALAANDELRVRRHTSENHPNL